MTCVRSSNEKQGLSMIGNLANYLGSPVSTMLSVAPFKFWPVQKSFEHDLEEPIVQYVFPLHGLEMRCDRDDKISVIFLHSDEFNGFDEGLLDAPFSFIDSMRTASRR